MDTSVNQSLSVSFLEFILSGFSTNFYGDGRNYVWKFQQWFNISGIIQVTDTVNHETFTYLYPHDQLWQRPEDKPVIRSESVRIFEFFKRIAGDKTPKQQHFYGDKYEPSVRVESVDWDYIWDTVKNSEMCCLETGLDGELGLNCYDNIMRVQSESEICFVVEL